jgi:hypothetical protein
MHGPMNIKSNNFTFDDYVLLANFFVQSGRNLTNVSEKPPIFTFYPENIISDYTKGTTCKNTASELYSTRQLVSTIY